MWRRRRSLAQSGEEEVLSEEVLKGEDRCRHQLANTCKPLFGGRRKRRSDGEKPVKSMSLGPVPRIHIVANCGNYSVTLGPANLTNEV